MFPASVSGIVNGEAPVSYWPIFLTLATVPEAFAKVNSAQFSFLIKLHVKLDWCCIELHHGSVLGTLPLLSLAIARLRRKLVKTRPPVQFYPVTSTLQMADRID